MHLFIRCFIRKTVKMQFVLGHRSIFEIRARRARGVGRRPTPIGRQPVARAAPRSGRHPRLRTLPAPICNFEIRARRARGSNFEIRRGLLRAIESY